MSHVWALYRLSAPGTLSGAPLVMGIFQSAADAQMMIRPASAPDAEWRPPRPGRRHWELTKNGYLYAIEQFLVQEPNGVHQGESTRDVEHAPIAAVSVERVRQLEAHVSERIEESVEAARESYENWIASETDAADKDRRRLRENERFYLGQATAFAWIAGCLDWLFESLAEQHGHGVPESAPASAAREAEIRAIDPDMRQAASSLDSANRFGRGAGIAQNMVQPQAG